MPPISALTLKNVQSHKASVLTLHPLFNIVIGSSNSGKSTLIRSLLFQFTGLWSKSYVRFGSKDSEVITEFDNGVTVERVRGSVNKASKIDALGVRTDFSGFGDTLPIDISSAFGVTPFRIDKDKAIDLNVSMQHDPLFLLKETGSYCAKILGRLSGLHLIDIAIRNLNNDSRTATQRIGDEQNRIDSATKELEKYSGIEEKQEKVRVLRAEVDRQQQLKAKIEKINILLRELHSFNQDIQSHKEKKIKLDSINMVEIQDSFVTRLVGAGHCPTCGSNIDESIAKRCLSHV